MAEFKLSRIRYTWKGNWSSSVNYIPDDVVQYGGKVYVCLVQHTSSSEIYTDINFVNADIPPVSVPRWELMLDGSVWKNVWTPNTFYDINDLVRYNGIIYKCITVHTSSDSDSASEQEFENDKEFWTKHVSGYDWRAAWTPETYYRLNDVIKHGGNIYKCVVEHTSSATTNIGIEPDLSNWEIISLSDRWRGDWEFDTKYIENDIIRYGSIVYRCTVGHVSKENSVDQSDEDVFDSEFESDLDKWEIVHSGILYKGDWSNETLYYKVNDLVKFGGSLWIANETHAPSDEFDVNKWILYSPGFQYENIWTVENRYQFGDIVRYGGYLYKSLTKNVGLIPSQSPSDWILIQAGVNLRGEWKPLVQYEVGDIVRRNGQLYTALIDSVQEDPNTNATAWELTIPGEFWRDFWQYPVVYLIGDIVNYLGSAYRCVQKHTSSSANRPDVDTQNDFWELEIQGAEGNVLSQTGDIKTVDFDEDFQDVRKVRVPIGRVGKVAKVVDSSVKWEYLDESDGVFFVGTDGVDDEFHGNTLQNPWRTVRYACENVTGPATIYVKHGVYREVLPIRVPAFVAIVGDELRGTEIRPAPTIVSGVDVSATLNTFNRIDFVIKRLLSGLTVTTPIQLEQVFPETPVTISEIQIVDDLINDHVTVIRGLPEPEIISTNIQTLDPGRLLTAEILSDNREFIIEDALQYADSITESITTPTGNGEDDSTIGFLIEGDEGDEVDEGDGGDDFDPMDVSTEAYNYNREKCRRDLNLILDAIIYDLEYPGNWKVVEAGRYYANAADGDKNARSNMFLFQDGTGLRNMTLSGLKGELTPPGGVSSELTPPLVEAEALIISRRPTAGAFASLDTGWGPEDNNAWVGTRSPYIQNVTTFGEGCVGLKVDGRLHNGGNKTIVANDFTQILSDGIGAWMVGDGASELVSVFTYYNHIGYLVEDGGKIRATNGNNSYGNFGCVATGVDPNEVPINATVFNQYFDAVIGQVFVIGGSVSKFLYSNAGQNYTQGNFNITGSGINAAAVMDEFRDNAVFEVRITDPGDSSAAGGSGYLFTTNSAQGGTSTTVTIAGSDVNQEQNYLGMRVFLTGGTGAGQYGYIAAYDDVSKVATIAKESDDTPGWDHIVPGTPIANFLDTTTAYAIEPRIIFSSPGFSFVDIGESTLTEVNKWRTLAFDKENNLFVALAEDGTVANLNPDGVVWIQGNNINSQFNEWTSIAHGNGRFVAVAADGGVAWANSETNGMLTWNVSNLSGQWQKVIYDGNKFVAVASDGDVGAYSINGTSWITVNLGDFADWKDIAYGKGIYVAIAPSDSTVTGITTSSDEDITTWSAEDKPVGSWRAVAYGNDKFVALESDKAYFSFDGNTWSNGITLPVDKPWADLIYSQGLFIAIAENDPTVLISSNGISWETQSLGESENWSSVAYGGGKFVVISGAGSDSAGGDEFRMFKTGVTPQARVRIVAGRISAFFLWETGSGYTSPPAVIINDPNTSSDVTFDVRIADYGVLSSPSFIDRGNFYLSTTIRATVFGNGFADSFQLGKDLVVTNIDRLPSPGDNLSIAGIDDFVYKVVSAELLEGTVPNAFVKLTIIKELDRAESPEQGTAVSIRQNYSQVRITGHDFLDIGLGNFVQTNYPDTLNPNGTVLSPENEFNEIDGGRVFYTSTDQDGNFRVGELFRVDQATGAVTLNAEFFQLEGLEEIKLGGVTVGGTGVVIREFSTDATFTADSNNIIPTQRAIKRYLSQRVSGGGSDAITGGVVSGTVQVGPNQFDTTTGLQIDIPRKVNFTGGVDGSLLALKYFLRDLRV